MRGQDCPEESLEVQGIQSQREQGGVQRNPRVQGSPGVYREIQGIHEESREVLRVTF